MNYYYYYYANKDWYWYTTFYSRKQKTKHWKENPAVSKEEEKRRRKKNPMKNNSFLERQPFNLSNVYPYFLISDSINKSPKKECKAVYGLCFTVLSWFPGWGFLVWPIDGACLVRAYLYRKEK